jgi:hypothetical protein
MAPADLDLDHIRYFLRQNGWVPTKDDSLKQIWTLSRGVHVILPNERLADFDELVANLVAKVASTSDLSEDDVAVAIAWPGYDKLAARSKASSADPTLSVEAGLGVHDALRDLLVASARSAEQARPFHRGGWPSSVSTYLDLVRLIPSVPGSFTVRALLPIASPLPEAFPFVDLPAERVRRVTQTLLTGVRAARAATVARIEGAPATVFDEAVEQGVSADLLDAVVRLAGSPELDSAVELAVSWTYAAPTAPVEPIRIEAQLLPIVSWAADYLRGGPETFDLTVTGLVVTLHRTAPLGAGEVTVRGFVEGDGWGSSTRNLKMELDESTYNDATEAHRQGRTVRAVCRVERDVAALRVLGVERFRVEDAT